MTEEQFYELQPIAIFGVSARGRGFGASAYQELRKAGLQVYPINPKGGRVGEQVIYASLDGLPEPAQAAVILTKGEGAVEAVEECSQGSIGCVWLQGGSDTEEIRQLCDELGIKRMTGSCVLMRKGGFPHNLHRFLHDLFKGKSTNGKDGESSSREAK